VKYHGILAAPILVDRREVAALRTVLAAAHAMQRFGSSRVAAVFADLPTFQS
jgi:hypothetical protein